MNSFLPKSRFALSALPLSFLHQAQWFLIAGCLLLGLVSCKAELPPVTKVGANTVGALIDGEVWLPQINGLRPNISASIDAQDSILVATAINLGLGTYFLWELGPQVVAGTYLMADWADAGIAMEYGELSEQAGEPARPYPLVPGTGALEISVLDRENGVFAGEFFFDATAPNQQNVTIRDGRFDVRF